MTRIFTPPDYDSNRSISKVYIFNCPWSDEQLSQLAMDLEDKKYDIYIYCDDRNDVQWAEGIRTHAIKTYNWRHYKDMPAQDFLRMIDNDF